MKLAEMQARYPKLVPSYLKLRLVSLKLAQDLLREASTNSKFISCQFLWPALEREDWSEAHKLVNNGRWWHESNRSN